MNIEKKIYCHPDTEFANFNFLFFEAFKAGKLNLEDELKKVQKEMHTEIEILVQQAFDCGRKFENSNDT